MDIVIQILQFVMSFSLLVIVHEMGHFMFARMFGIRVEKFYLFFNPWFSLLKFKIGHTEYGIGWIPFGGYVKIAGMIDESFDTDQMASEPKPYEFRSKPAWQRLLVMTGGVIMNVVLAVMVFVGMTWAWGDRYVANEDVTNGWAFNTLAHEVGFRDGDRILSVGGQSVENAGMVYAEIVINNAPDVEVLRDGEPMTVNIDREYVSMMLESPDFMTPRIPFIAGGSVEGSGAEKAGILPGDSLVALNGEPLIFFDQFVKHTKKHAQGSVELTYWREEDGVARQHTATVDVSEQGTMGIYPVSNLATFFPVRTHSYTFAQSIPTGISRAGTEIANYWKQVKMLFTPKTQAYKSLGGPITIFRFFPDYWSWEIFWQLTALLSIVLAVMNLLPIPGLDGGHVVFLLYEMIARRKPSEKFLLNAQTIGVLLLFILIIYATGNDIQRLLK